MVEYECDNIRECHDLKDISDGEALRVICKVCHKQEVIRKDQRGVPEKRQYAKLFKRTILQGNDNLFYRYNPQHILK